MSVLIDGVEQLQLRKMEEDAIEFYKQGNFVSSRESYEKILQSTELRSGHIGERCEFNIATCRAAEGDLMGGLVQLLDLKDAAGPTDFEGIFNKALGLCRLNKPDLALSLIGILGKDVERVNGTEYSEQFVKLSMDCMSRVCKSGTLSRKQCGLMERLLLDYQTPIIKLVGERQWTQNLGHVLFLTDTRFDECLHWYETLLNEAGGQSGNQDAGDEERVEDLSNADPEVLCNLCVSYILTGRNRDAEDLIKEIEQIEEPDYGQTTGSIMFHRKLSGDENLQHEQMSRLTQVNLAIGTLYCVKGNHEFGLMRIFKSLEPVEEKLNAQTWRQASKCILSTLDKHCRQMICIRDELFDQIVSFLVQCEIHGIYIRLRARDGSEEASEDGKNSVTSQARQLRAIVLSLIHD